MNSNELTAVFVPIHRLRVRMREAIDGCRARADKESKIAIVGILRLEAELITGWLHALEGALESVQPPAEWCLVAALKVEFETTGTEKVIYGHRHCDCISRALAMTAVGQERTQRGVQGFVTNLGRFVDRREGMALMKASGKNSFMTGKPFDGEVLTSEELY